MNKLKSQVVELLEKLCIENAQVNTIINGKYGPETSNTISIKVRCEENAKYSFDNAEKKYIYRNRFYTLGTPEIKIGDTLIYNNRTFNIKDIIPNKDVDGEILFLEIWGD